MSLARQGRLPAVSDIHPGVTHGLPGVLPAPTASPAEVARTGDVVLIAVATNEQTRTVTDRGVRRAVRRARWAQRGAVVHRLARRLPGVGGHPRAARRDTAGCWRDRRGRRRQCTNGTRASMTSGFQPGVCYLNEPVGVTERIGNPCASCASRLGGTYSIHTGAAGLAAIVLPLATNP